MEACLECMFEIVVEFVADEAYFEFLKQEYCAFHELQPAEKRSKNHTHMHQTFTILVSKDCFTPADFAHALLLGNKVGETLHREKFLVLLKYNLDIQTSKN